MSILQELDDSAREAEAMLDSNAVPAWALLSFEARFELLVRWTIRHFTEAETELERQERAPSSTSSATKPSAIGYDDEG